MNRERERNEREEGRGVDRISQSWRLEFRAERERESFCLLPLCELRNEGIFSAEVESVIWFKGNSLSSSRNGSLWLSAAWHALGHPRFSLSISLILFSLSVSLSLLFFSLFFPLPLYFPLSLPSLSLSPISLSLPLSLFLSLPYLLPCRPFSHGSQRRDDVYYNDRHLIKCKG